MDLTTTTIHTYDYNYNDNDNHQHNDFNYTFNVVEPYSSHSYNSVSTTTFDSRLSTQSSSSSISAWAPRERSSSVSSHTSNDSVNLDALIAEGSDINEECPLELEEGDEVEWSREQRATRN
ncbi:hypothetical protein BX616_006776, partial [Lobosporangium transversale]